MTPDLEREAARICEAALDRPAAERAAFVAAECTTDEALRREVESLLRQQSNAEQFLERPAFEVAATQGEAPRGLVRGQQIGPYQTQGLLGAGGMGEVYRARDTKLGRDVAIKVLPGIFTSDPERLARFEREARLLAALNHPNIGAIYGLENIDGTPALILELVDGPTLADRLMSGPLPVPYALEIAGQIADALEAAHGKGIIHRDLKPANIKITPDGIVKVLDFGLAKEATGAGAGSDPSQSPTGSLGGTREGLILGTAAYMSPEQARGQRVDKRSDIWAFGCVVYEILTGRAAFAGDTVSDTIAATLEREPGWQALPPATPQKLDGLLRRCLQKDPQHRLRDIGDARLDIDDAIAAPSTAGTDAVAGRRLTGASVLAAVISVLALLPILILILMRPQPAVPAADLALTIVPPAASGIAPVTSGGGLATPKISPDGSFVAYFDRSRTLQLRRLNSTSPEQLPGVDGAWFVWSPDSKFLVFVEGNTLKRIRVPDGAPEIIGPAPPGVFDGMGKSGVVLFMMPDFSLRLAPRAGAEASAVRVPGLKDGSYGSVSSLPGGDDFLIRFVPQGSEQSEIYLVTVRNGNLSDPVLLMSNADAPKYTPAGGGLILFVRNDNLYAQKLNRRTRRLEGDPELVQRGVASGGPLAAFSVSHSGIVAWRSGRAGLAQVTIFDRQGTPIGTAGPMANTGGLKLSPDEQHVLLAERNGRAWLLEPNQPGRHELGQGHLSMLWAGASGFLVPQGSRVVAHAVARLNGGRELVRVPDLVRLEDVSADGTIVLFRKSSWSDLFSVRLNGRPEDRVPTTVQTGKLISNVRFSPDERWIVYQVDGPEQEAGVYVQQFPGPALPKQIASTGQSPVWRKDGKEIAYLDRDRIWSVPVDTSGGQFRPGMPEALFSVRSMEGPRRVRGISQLAVSRDGSRIYYQQPVEQPSDSDVIYLRMGWVR